MRLVLAGWCLCAAAQAADLDGVYTLKARDGYLVSRMKVTGSTVQGVIEVPDGNIIRLNGTAKDNQARGVARSNKGNGDFLLTLDGDTLNLTIVQKAARGQNAVVLPLRFQRAQIATPTRHQ